MKYILISLAFVTANSEPSLNIKELCSFDKTVPWDTTEYDQAYESAQSKLDKFTDLNDMDRDTVGNVCNFQSKEEN